MRFTWNSRSSSRWKQRPKQGCNMFEKDVLKVIYVLQTISSITKVSVHPLPLCCNCRFLDARLDKMSHRADLLPGDYRSMLISHAVFYCSMPLSSSHVFFVVSHQFTVSAIRLLKKKKKKPWLAWACACWLHRALCTCSEHAKARGKRWKGRESSKVCHLPTGSGASPEEEPLQSCPSPSHVALEGV